MANQLNEESHKRILSYVREERESSLYAAVCTAAWSAGHARAEANRAARQTDLEVEREDFEIREERRRIERQQAEEDRQAFLQWEAGDSEREVLAQESARYFASRYGDLE